MRRFEAKIVLALVLASVLPLTVSLWVVNALISRGIAFATNPEAQRVVEQAGVIYREFLVGRRLLHEEAMRALAEDPEISALAWRGGGGEAEGAGAALERGLRARLARRPFLAWIEVVAGPAAALESSEASGRSLARVEAPPPGEGDEAAGADVVALGWLVPQPPARAAAAGDARLLRAGFRVPAGHVEAFERLGDTARALRILAREEGQIRAESARAAGVVLLGAVLVSVLLGLVISRSVTRRVARVAQAVERVARGDLQTAVEARGDDEVGALMRSFNQMVEELRQSRERIGYLEKISAWQEVARRLAHEIKNPLTPINLAVQELHRTYRGDDPRYRKVLDASVAIVEEEVATLKRLVEAFSSFAKLPQMQAAEAELGDLVDDVMRANAHFGEEAAVEWGRPVDAVRVRVDRLMIRQVLVNLLRNGIQAAQGAGVAPRVRVVIEPRSRRGSVLLTVEDNGPGVPAEHRRRVFDPYFTTKSDGTGLGLAIVRKIVLMHSGDIEVCESKELGGARFIVELPLAGREPKNVSGAFAQPPISAEGAGQGRPAEESSRA